MSTRIEFGKYKGSLIEDLPSDYLHWLAERCNDEEVAQAADEEYRRRDDHEAHWYAV